MFFFMLDGFLFLGRVLGLLLLLLRRLVSHVILLSETGLHAVRGRHHGPDQGPTILVQTMHGNGDYRFARQRLFRQVPIVAFQNAEELCAGEHEHPRDAIAFVVTPRGRDDFVKTSRGER